MPFVHVFCRFLLWQVQRPPLPTARARRCVQSMHTLQRIASSTPSSRSQPSHLGEVIVSVNAVSFRSMSVF